MHECFPDGHHHVLTNGSVYVVFQVKSNLKIPIRVWHARWRGQHEDRGIVSKPSSTSSGHIDCLSKSSAPS